MENSFVTQIIVYRNTWLGNQKLLIDLVVNINLDSVKKTVHNLFTTSPLKLLNKTLEK